MSFAPTHFAALSDATLDDACTGVANALGLDEFEVDEEHEGDDWWEYASATTNDVRINISRLGHYSNPTAWRWMMGAPASANFQIVLRGTDDQVAQAKDALECVLGTLAPYPDDFFIK